MGKSKPYSWLGYLNSLQQRTYSPEELNVEGIEKILNLNQHFHSVFNHSIPWMYLLDYTTGKYLLISKSMKHMLGYSPEDFLNCGIDFTLDIYNRQHLHLFNNEIFPDRLSLLNSIPPTEHANYIFSYNLDLKKQNGESITILQRNCFIKSDEKGNPLLSFGVITNINHFKRDNTVIQVVEKINKDAISSDNDLIFKKTYFLNEENKLFTKREKELLLFMTDGLTSKQIADKLFISENTVINHRRNMHEKTSTKNVAELISFALKRGII